MRNNHDRKQIAAQTAAILEAGTYRSALGTDVPIAGAFADSVDNTVCYLPDELDEIARTLPATRIPPITEQIEVTGESTLEAAARIRASDAHQRIAVLNFASARNPGGGFLSGAQAQEESLARCSGLYASLSICTAHYQYHRDQKSCLYSDRMIYTPACPVIRDQNEDLLAEPYLVDVITAAAPNAGAIRRDEPANVDQIAPVLENRARKVVALAAHRSVDSLILGAWGCGVFRNDPVKVANAFARAIESVGHRFSLITFAVLDRADPPSTRAAFDARFASLES